MGNGRNLGKKGSGIRAVVLDYGEVLCERPKKDALLRMAQVIDIEPNRFLALYSTSRDPYDQGVVSAEEYWEDFAKRAGMRVDRSVVGQLRRLDTEMWSSTSPEMMEWVDRLNESELTTAVLSNMQHDMAAYARKNFPWFANLDHQILSCEVGLIKPDPAIFHETVRRVGVGAEEALFVDDREANVNAARETGIVAIRFQSPTQLCGELEDMGFEVLPRVPGAGESACG
ncbi:MAG: HAD family phosphatase [Candidatus Acidiferrum sp.]